MPRLWRYMVTLGHALATTNSALNTGLLPFWSSDGQHVWFRRYILVSLIFLVVAVASTAVLVFHLHKGGEARSDLLTVTPIAAFVAITGTLWAGFVLYVNFEYGKRAHWVAKVIALVLIPVFWFVMVPLFLGATLVFVVDVIPIKWVILIIGSVVGLPILWRMADPSNRAPNTATREPDYETKQYDKYGHVVRTWKTWRRPRKP